MAYHILYSQCPLYQLPPPTSSSNSIESTTTVRCAAERNITGNDVAYLIALNSGRLLSFVLNLYSTMHCLKRTAYGKLQTQTGSDLSCRTLAARRGVGVGVLTS